MTDVNDLDPTAARANDPGWTPEAIRRERMDAAERKRQEKKRDKIEGKARAKAGRAAFLGAIGGGIAAVWDFIVRNILLALALAGVIGGGIFEWSNSFRGWGDLYPGINFAIIFAGAGGAVVLWYVAASMAIDQWRKPKRDMVEAIGWSVASFLAYAVTVVGVFVATATNSVDYQEAAKKSRLELVELTTQRNALKDDLEIYNAEYWDQTATQIQRTIDSRTNTARMTWGLPNLDVDGGCSGAHLKPGDKLPFEARRMCARVNGGDDPSTGEQISGVRAELENVKRQAKQAKLDEERLAELEDKVKNFVEVKGDQTAKAMENLQLGASGEQSVSILYWFLSSAFLLLMGWAGHWSLTQIRDLRVAARVKKGLAV